MLIYYFRKSSEPTGKVFPCDSCEYKGSTSSNLTHHKMSKHQGNIRYSGLCKACVYKSLKDALYTYKAFIKTG